MDGVPHSGSGDENDDLHHSLLTQAAAEADGSPHAETVTVTLTQHPGEGRRDSGFSWVFLTLGPRFKKICFVERPDDNICAE